MTDPRTWRRPAWLDTLVLALAAAGLIVAAARVMFSAFMFYDDEGYVLFSLRNFAEHGGLYRDVYSQYGPFPFVFHYILQSLGLPLTHTVGRGITLLAWGAAAVLGAVVVVRATRSLVAALAVLAGLFAYLWVMASEPTHPGGLIVLLTSVLAVVGHQWLVQERVRAWALLAGAVTAALALTKINIGAFAAFAVGGWLLLHHRSIAVHRWAPAVLLIGAGVLPLGLMRPLLGAEWVQTFALAWACAAMAVVRSASPTTEGRADWATLAWVVAGGAGVAVGVVGVVLARGSSLAEIIDGVVLAPTRQPTTFSIRYLWLPGTRLFALGSLGLCMLALAARRRRRRRVDTAVAIVRLLAAVALAVHLARFPAISADYLVFGLVLPLLWPFAWSLAGEEPRVAQARAWLVLVLLGQCLHVFPVAGSQIAWGTFLALPLAAMGAWDAARWLARTWAGDLTAPRWRLGFGVAVAGVALFAGAVAREFTLVGERYREGENLGLPGAELLRLPEGSSALFRLLTLNAIAHADVLFSEPGMFSFNVWSGVPAPTRANVTHWFSLLSRDRQEEIIRRLEASPRAVVIVHREHVDFLAKRGLAPKGVLHDFIAREFAPVFTLDDFEFCVRRGRRIAPFLVAEWLTRSDASGPAELTRENTLLRFSVLLPAAAPVERLEFVGAPRTGPLILDRTNTRVEITPLNARGDPVGAPRAGAWPLVLTSPAQVAVYFDRTRLPPPGRNATVALRAADGREVALVRLLP